MNSTPRFLAGGELVPFDSSETIDVVNPATEETIGKIGDANKRDVDRAVSAARDAFENSGWARMSPQERAVYVTALAKAFDKYGESISSQITDQNGITLGLSRKVNYERPQGIYALFAGFAGTVSFPLAHYTAAALGWRGGASQAARSTGAIDRKSTRLNSSQTCALPIYCACGA